MGAVTAGVTLIVLHTLQLSVAAAAAAAHVAHLQGLINFETLMTSSLLEVQLSCFSRFCQVARATAAVPWGLQQALGSASRRGPLASGVSLQTRP